MASAGTTPSLARLELFVSVVRLGSLTRAAKSHRVSQPSVSAAMSRLERRLGIPLLVRDTSGASATPEGRAVAAAARELLDAAGRFCDAVAEVRRDAESALTVSASYTIAEYLLPGWISRCREALAAVAIAVAVENSERVAESVLSRRADLGFIEGPTIPDGLCYAPLATDDLVVVVSPDHPWAHRAEPLSVAELAAARLVVREAGSGTRAALEELISGHRQHPPPRPLLQLGSTTAVKAAVLDGTGPAALSRLAVRSELRSGRLKAVPVEGVRLQRTLHAIWLGGVPLKRAASTLIDDATQHDPRAGERVS